MIGKTVGNYKVIAQLGEGGMGVVYLAEHPLIGSKVAVKVLHEDLGKDPEAVSRFFNEARSVNDIRHPNIVEISDFGALDGSSYIIMEFLEGEALSRRIDRCGTLDEAAAAQIASQVAAGLGAAHARGIIHRDLKPDNVFLKLHPEAPEHVKVLDFGVAKLVKDPLKVSHRTRTGAVVGTPYYMSPEQCTGKRDLDGRSDVYALGILLYEMVTGDVPFGGDSLGEIIIAHAGTPPPRLRERNPNVSEAFEAIVLKALAKRREDRHQTMEELRQALVRFTGARARAPSVGELAVTIAPNAPTRRGASSPPVVTTLSSSIGTRPSTLPRVGARSGTWTFGIIGASLVAVAAVLLIATRGGSDDEAAEPAPAQPEVAAKQVPATTPEPEPPAPRPPEPKLLVSVRSNVPAEIFRDGKKLGTTPVDVEVPVDGRAIDLVARKPGYLEQVVTVSSQHGEAVDVELQPKKKRKKKKKKTGNERVADPESFELEAVE